MNTVKRLIDQFIPTKYELSMSLDRADHKFHGLVTVYGASVGDSGTISLHAKDLNIVSALVDGHEATFDYGENDELIISSDEISDGQHVIVIDFDGDITDGMHGIYPCYFNHDGQRKQLIATQFESHHAREAFPCIDEPEAKATFDVTLTTETGVEVLSNMPIARQSEQEGSLVTSFEQSPRMSTYLLAWVVGDMHSKSAKTKTGVDVNIWATSAQGPEQLDFALEYAVKSIEFFEDYFDVPYPLPKIDHVALPDFSSGAMENWGLITYREVLLLADPKRTGVSGKHAIATVVSHELAHQWFGNLVTMKWWNDLWLNESFADFVEHIAVDHIHPEWDTWLDFTLSRGIAALRRDAIDGVQSVKVEIHHPDEISTIFDAAIVYGKGARLMKMLRSYIGDDAFRKGIKQYFTKFAYQNTEGADLWQCLSEASDKDVGSFMNAWLLQPGYPVLKVEPGSISQEQFFIGNHAPSQRQWPILLSANPAGDLPEMLEEAKLDVTTSENQRFNTGDLGHFVTKYSPAHLDNLLSTIAEASAIDRLTLLNDQTLLVRGGYESSTTLVDVLPHYKAESNDTVWDIISMTVSELKKFVEDDEAAKQKLRDLSGSVALPTFKRLGIDPSADDSVTDTKLRSTALAMMLYSEDRSIIKDTVSRFSLETFADLPAETRPLIISAAVRYGDDPSLVDSLVDIYKTTSSAELREDIMSGLTSTRSPEAAASLLDYCMDSDVVRPQDVAPWFIYLLRNTHTRHIAWQWLRDNWDWIIKTYSGDKSFDEFPRYAASGLINDQQLQEYKDFFGPMSDDPSLRRTIAMGISEIEGRLELLSRDGDAVRDKLKS
ncbi:MAG: M1 family metallopeptidase [bacterium]|nr:M1 family metallopeptidase [bacterium]